MHFAMGIGCCSGKTGAVSIPAVCIPWGSLAASVLLQESASFMGTVRCISSGAGNTRLDRCTACKRGGPYSGCAGL